MIWSIRIVPVKMGTKSFFMINCSRYLYGCDLKALVYPVIERSAYFTHPENIVLSMLTDNDKHIRELGCSRVIKARSLKLSELRSFKIPKIGFDSNTYHLIDWQSEDLVLTEPPLLREISTDDLKKIVDKGKIKCLISLNFLVIPNRSNDALNWPLKHQVLLLVKSLAMGLFAQDKIQER